MRRLRVVSRSEFVIASAALLGVLAVGIVWGVFIGVGLSLLPTISFASNPNTEVLGRIPNTDHFVSFERYPEATEDADVVVYRVDAGPFYANTNVVRDDLEARLDARAPRRSPSWCSPLLVTHRGLRGRRVPR